MSRALTLLSRRQYLSRMDRFQHGRSGANFRTTRPQDQSKIPYDCLIYLDPVRTLLVKPTGQANRCSKIRQDSSAIERTRSSQIGIFNKD